MAWRESSDSGVFLFVLGFFFMVVFCLGALGLFFFSLLS